MVLVSPRLGGGCSGSELYGYLKQELK